MNEIIIRNLDDASVQRLRQLAWRNGRPLEEVVRVLVLEAAKAREPKWPNARFPVPTD
jgi:plasmid stability protein